MLPGPRHADVPPPDIVGVRPVIRFQAFGARIGVEAPGLEAGLSFSRPPGAVDGDPGADVDGRYLVEPVAGPSPAASGASGSTGFALRWQPSDESGVEALGVHDSPADIGRAIAADVHFRVARHARDWLFVHAGTVCVGGHAILLPGRTLTGKSSLVLALVRAGAKYFSDEYAVLSPGGDVHAYPKPLSRRRPDGSVDLIDLGGAGAGEAAPIGLVVETRHEPGATWEPAECSSGDAVLALFDNTVVARIAPRFALETLTRGVRGSVGLRGVRGDAEETARAVIGYAKRAFGG